VRAGLMLDVNEFAVEYVTAIDPGPRDVVVQIGASGVCHSDVSVLNGDAGCHPPLSWVTKAQAPSTGWAARCPASRSATA
jgi:D-arabinose 1-dehydrogenase-like Zn-dependent alcohol dehydrogenase